MYKLLTVFCTTLQVVIHVGIKMIHDIVSIVLGLIGMEAEDKDIFSYDDEVITNGWLMFFFLFDGGEIKCRSTPKDLDHIFPWSSFL